jgi:circadian clock protein KaiB
VLYKRKPSFSPHASAQSWDLRLYVAGPTPRSIAAFSNLKRICEEHLAGRYRIELVDVLEDPGLARRDRVFAIPTVVRERGTSKKGATGDLSDTVRVLAALNLPPRT